MAVPGFQEWFLPLLKRISDNKIHEIRPLYSAVAGDMKLSDEDMAELLPSGKQYVYQNRIGWANTYLKKAGLVEAAGRAQVKITDEGLRILNNPPVSVKSIRNF